MQIDFPLDIDIFDDELALADGLANRLKVAKDGFALLTGKTVSARYADILLERAQVSASYCKMLASNDVDNVYSIERELRSVRPSLIVAIGGGKVADFAKRLAYLTNIPLLLIPTIIANDGLISPIAVLKDDDASVSLPGRMPDMVLIDLAVISAADPRYLRAAACDLITNLSATNDWIRSSGGDSARVHHLALQMSRMAAHQVLDCREWSHNSPIFLRSIVYGQMLSGIAMALAGSSRPCSGSEHLICHAMDSMGLAPSILHGEKVGVASRFCLYLQQVSDPQLEHFYHIFEISAVFPGCENFSEERMIELFAKARLMRPGRTTILDNFSDSELAKEYLAYLQKNERNDL